MLSSWKAALTSRRAAAAVLLALALCACGRGASAGGGYAQEVGDTLKAPGAWISKVRWEGIELLDRRALTGGSYFSEGEVLTDSSPTGDSPLSDL